jgi:hypothetical protein
MEVPAMRRQLRQRLTRIVAGDGNPLQRHVDRVESAIVAGLVVAFFVAAPLLSLVAVKAAGAAAVREQRAEHGWQPVPAVLTQSAAGEIAGGDLETSWVKASWIAPDGAHCRGRLAVGLNARKGQHVTIYVTPAGQLTRQPLTSTQVLQWEITGAVLAPFAVALVLVVAGCGVRVVANRRRMAGWTRAWAATGPRWSSLR